MAHPELALRRARGAYERAHVATGLRGLAIAAVVTILAIGLHRANDLTWLVAGSLAITLGTLGWRGGSWRRGAFAGVLAGLPPLVVPAIVFALGHGGHCADCVQAPTLGCLLACFGTSSLFGIVVGHRATTDASPMRFALAAIGTAALTGLLNCGTTGLGGAIGVVAGLVAGGITGWVVAARTAQV
jgi:hypothetical protein